MVLGKVVLQESILQSDISIMEMESINPVENGY